MQGICAVPVERDAQGFWTHPAMLQANLETSAEMTYWLRSRGLECWVMFMRDEDPEAFLAGFDEDCPDARGWNPSPPPGRAGSSAPFMTTRTGLCACGLGRPLARLTHESDR